jgi:hypothetical protein
VKRVALAVVLVLLAACGGDDPFAPLADPGPVPDVPPQTTIPLGNASAVLPAVPGTTTTTAVALFPGPARLRGRVQGPDGPVAGATVQLERLVGDASATHRVVTGPDGGWDVPAVLGGRYRVRAWRPPDLATPQAEVLFLAGGDPVEVDLALARLGTLRVDAVAAPATPVEGEPANLVVRVSARVVDVDGVARETPQSGVAVSLTGSGAWTVTGANPTSTDVDGTAQFQITCFTQGAPPLSLSVAGATEVPTLPGCA